MHASVKDLISARDGEPLGAEAAMHLAVCAECRAALGPLERMRSDLRQLPDFDPPQHSWAVIERRLRAKHATAPTTAAIAPAASVIGPLGWRTAASTAVVAALVLLLASVMHWRPPAMTGAGAAKGAPGQRATVGVLVARSQQLEALLNGLPRPSVERAATSAAIDELEARIEVLDLQLSNAAESGLDGTQTQDLWSQRVQLLNSLVSVRYAEQTARGNGWPAFATGDI